MHRDVRQQLHARIVSRGGFVNAHSHLDIAEIVGLPVLAMAGESYGLSGARIAELPLATKMSVLDEQVRSSPDYYDSFKSRLRRLLTEFCASGVRAVRTCVTVSPALSLFGLEQLCELRQEFAERLVIQIAAMHLGSVMKDSAERNHFEGVVRNEMVDLISGLPQVDSESTADYLEWLFELAGTVKKPLEVHCDEYLTDDEMDSEQTARACATARAGGYIEPVAAIHSAALACKSPAERLEVSEALAAAEVAVVVCPRSSLSMAARDTPNYLHNCIAPIAELLAAGVHIALGTDNIRDMFLPFSDGSMWSEVEFLAEASRFYDLDVLADIASTNGARLLGLDDG